MKKRVFVASFTVLAMVFVLLAGSAFAQPKQITFCVKMYGSYDNMKNARLGNMVSPDGACSYWSGDPANKPCWVWYNMGQGTQKFALTSNYDLLQGGDFVAATVHGIVIADPAAMPMGSESTVNITLRKCSLGEGNDVLAVYSVDGIGARKDNCSSVPACSNWK